MRSPFWADRATIAANKASGDAILALIGSDAEALVKNVDKANQGFKDSMDDIFLEKLFHHGSEVGVYQ